MQGLHPTFPWTVTQGCSQCQGTRWAPHAQHHGVMRRTCCHGQGGFKIASAATIPGTWWGAPGALASAAQMKLPRHVCMCQALPSPSRVGLAGGSTLGFPCCGRRQALAASPLCCDTRGAPDAATNMPASHVQRSSRPGLGLLWPPFPPLRATCGRASWPASPRKTLARH